MTFCIRAVRLSLLDIIIDIVTAITLFYTSVMKPYINSVTLHNMKSRNRKENTLCTVKLKYQSPAKYLKIRSRHSQVFYRITALKKSKRLKENTSVTLLVLIQWLYQNRTLQMTYSEARQYNCFWRVFLISLIIQIINVLVRLWKGICRSIIAKVL